MSNCLECTSPPPRFQIPMPLTNHGCLTRCEMPSAASTIASEPNTRIWDWIKRYILFHNKQHPQDLDEEHISMFLSHLAVAKKVASSTQNQALCAIVFLYREDLKELQRHLLKVTIWEPGFNNVIKCPLFKPQRRPAAKTAATSLFVRAILF